MGKKERDEPKVLHALTMDTDSMVAKAGGGMGIGWRAAKRGTSVILATLNFFLNKIKFIGKYYFITSIQSI